MMRENEKVAFVYDLTWAIANSLVRKIQAGEVPEGWDGHELRCLVADKAADAASISEIRKEPRGKRAKNYGNEKLTRNLC